MATMGDWKCDKHGWVQGECVQCLRDMASAFWTGLPARTAEQERADVVAWLFQQARKGSLMGMWPTNAAIYNGAAAKAIARGDHEGAAAEEEG